MLRIYTNKSTTTMNTTTVNYIFLVFFFNFSIFGMEKLFIAEPDAQIQTDQPYQLEKPESQNVDDQDALSDDKCGMMKLPDDLVKYIAGAKIEIILSLYPKDYFRDGNGNEDFKALTLVNKRMNNILGFFSYPQRLV